MEYPLSQLKKYRELSENCIHDLARMVRRLEVSRNTKLLLKGNICTDLYLIEKGMLACYDLGGRKKNCTWIMTVGDFATSVKSFNNQVPSKEIIKTLTDCLLWALSKQHLEELSEKHVEFLRIRQILTDYYHDQGRQMEAMRMQHVEDFYEYLLETYPDITLNAPVTDLAALMGKSRQTLYDLIAKRPNGSRG
jgi:CRP-like cAMP-binding protein